MCFSATASFVTAGVTGVIGLVALSRTNDPRELPLAAAPIIFALQQTIEGLLWINLPWAPNEVFPAGLIFLFLIIAEVVWPVYAPIAVWLIEPNERRRQFMLLCVAVGVSVGAYLLWPILTKPHSAAVLGGHIVYLTEHKQSDLLAVGYLAATGLPLVLSSRRMMVALGAIILIGSAVAYFLYWQAFVSVWCFFAAAASVVILAHFELSRRQRLRMVGA